jgi:transcriptional repressor NrdR
VTETRVTADGLRRRRQCAECKRRFTTYEKIGPPNIRVAKRDGTIEPFDRDKLHRALARVTAHRNAVTPDDLDRLLGDLEGTVVESGRKTIPWSELVELVLARLRNVDPTSARRFESNYLDDSGALRLDHHEGAPGSTPPQLGLPLDED